MKDKKNTVTLLGYYGDDLTIACSAWTSTSREITKEKLNRVDKLINMLWQEGHHSVFEKGVVHFLVNTDIASHIHLLKHRIASINAESARYKELKEDKYYIPEDWGDIESNFSGDDNVLGESVNDKWVNILKDYTEVGNTLYHQCVKDLEPVLGRKRAKESARFFKTYNSQIQADVMFNLRSFANFLKLRNSQHAQKEIQEIAQQMLNLVKNIPDSPFKYTLESWKKNKLFEN
jgi:flavin-dependent thymidylate synthase